MDFPRTLLLLLVAVLLALSVALVMPFVQFFLLAVLLVYMLYPVQERLERRLQPRTAAAAIVAVATVTVVLPLTYVVWTALADAVAILEAIREGEVSLEEIEGEIWELTGMQVDLLSVLQSAASNVQFDSVLGVFGTVTHILVGLGLTMFLLFYFLKDRDALVRWLYGTVPLGERVQARLYEELNRIVKAVLLGHVLVALVQGLLAGIGLFATGIPNATFWTVVMTVLSLLPVVGSFLVWGPAAIFLFVNGQVIPAVALTLWGAVVVGISDDYLRPVVVDRYAKVNPSVIIIGVLGGIYVIGFMGIFFGPVVIGMLRATMDVFRDEFGPAY